MYVYGGVDGRSVNAGMAPRKNYRAVGRDAGKSVMPRDHARFGTRARIPMDAAGRVEAALGVEGLAFRFPIEDGRSP
jgi:hypothetical protein